MDLEKAIRSEKWQYKKQNDVLYAVVHAEAEHGVAFVERVQRLSEGDVPPKPREHPSELAVCQSRTIHPKGSSWKSTWRTVTADGSTERSQPRT